MLAISSGRKSVQKIQAIGDGKGGLEMSQGHFRYYTGESLAKALHMHLTLDERMRVLPRKKYRVHSDDFFSRLRRRVNPGKIFLVRFKDGGGVIIEAEDEEDALLEMIPFVAEGLHVCRDSSHAQIYNNSCNECQEVWGMLAEKVNTAHVTWLGWAQPDYNWVISV